MSKKRIQTDGAPGLSNNPFAGLGDALGDLPEGEAPAPAEDAPAAAPEQTPFAPKVIVRREKKGRGGKTATVVEGLRGDPQVHAQLARALGKALGCGASVEGSTLVVQGSQTDRVRAWLLERGATKVVIGN